MIEVFNKIQEYAEQKGFYAHQFEGDMVNICRPDSIPVKYVQVIHDDKQILSVYFDEGEVLSIMSIPYYEIYDFNEYPERFFPSQEDELFDLAKQKLDNIK